MQQIINIIRNFDNVLKLNSDYQITNFADTQRLADCVAGGSVTLSITVQNTQGVCAIDAVLPTLKVVLQNKNVEITENGEYNITFDNGYTGLKEVIVDVNSNTESYYQEGYNEGFSKGETEGYETGHREGDANGREEQKSLLESITITENGVYDNENGYDEITVEVDTSGAYNEGFDNGKVEGIEQGKEEQKALIQPITITENGMYTNENGYSPIDVNIDTDSYYNNGYNEGFSKGESEGYNEGYDVGVVNGKEQQKSLLESIKITENGVFDNENGYDEITVEIDTQSYYDNGYSTGYSEGVVNGVEQGKAEQKALLESITITENGTYTNENGYDEVIVDVPTGEGQPKVSVKDGLKFGHSTYTTIPDFYDFEGVTDMSNMFINCKGLTTIPQIDTSNVTNMSYMFYGCGNLLTIPQIDTSKVTNMSNMFYYYDIFGGDSNLNFLPPLDCSKVTNMNSYFGFNIKPRTSITEVGGWINLKCKWDDANGLVLCPNLTYESCINVLNGLYDFTGNGVTPTSSQGKLKVNSAFIEKLTEEDLQIAIRKGWTLTT